MKTASLRQKVRCVISAHRPLIGMACPYPASDPFPYHSENVKKIVKKKFHFLHFDLHFFNSGCYFSLFPFYFPFFASLFTFSRLYFHFY